MNARSVVRRQRRDRRRKHMRISRDAHRCCHNRRATVSHRRVRKIRDGGRYDVGGLMHDNWCCVDRRSDADRVVPDGLSGVSVCSRPTGKKQVVVCLRCSRRSHDGENGKCECSEHDKVFPRTSGGLPAWTPKFTQSPQTIPVLILIIMCPSNGSCRLLKRLSPVRRRPVGADTFRAELFLPSRVRSACARRGKTGDRFACQND